MYSTSRRSTNSCRPSPRIRSETTSQSTDIITVIEMAPPAKKLKVDHELSDLISGTPILTIFVGSDRVPFYVHEKLACHFSKYFKATFTGPYAEAQSKEVVWEDEEVEIVNLFVTWLYSRDIDFGKASQPVSDATSVDAKASDKGISKDDTFSIIFKLSAFAERRDTPCNNALNQFPARRKGC